MVIAGQHLSMLDCAFVSQPDDAGTMTAGENGLEVLVLQLPLTTLRPSP